MYKENAVESVCQAAYGIQAAQCHGSGVEPGIGEGHSLPDLPACLVPHGERSVQLVCTLGSQVRHTCDGDTTPRSNSNTSRLCHEQVSGLGRAAGLDSAAVLTAERVTHTHAV